jgi:putative ABC transport system substrate-binding protein
LQSFHGKAGGLHGANASLMKACETAARSLGMHLHVVNVERPEDFVTELSQLEKISADGVVISSSPLFYAQRTNLVDFAAKQRLPTIYHQSGFVLEAGLMSYGPDFRDLFRRSAIYVDKILKGAKPADLPVQQPTKFELVINLKTAKALGLTISPTLLARADEVIE